MFEYKRLASDERGRACATDGGQPHVTPRKRTQDGHADRRGTDDRERTEKEQSRREYLADCKRYSCDRPERPDRDAEDHAARPAGAARRLCGTSGGPAIV